MAGEANLNDFNQNINGSADPRLEGYLPVDYFAIVDTDYSSKRIRDISIPVTHFYDYNLENSCNFDLNDED